LWSVRPQAFKIELRENKLFIQPLEENVATNLYILTASTRPSYESIPAVNDAGQMDFAIDYRSPQPQANATKKPEATEADKRLPNEVFIPVLHREPVLRKWSTPEIPIVNSLTGVTTRKALSALW